MTANHQQEPKPPQRLAINTADEIQDILGHPPGWMLRWGISLVMIAVMLGLAISWLIKYPDIIEAPVQLTTEHPPIEVVAQQSGKVKKLFIEDQEQVTKGDLLAVIDNTANYTDVLKLANLLKGLERGGRSTSNYHRLSIPADLQLGELHVDFVQWRQSIQAFQYFLNRHTLFQRISAMEAEIQQIEQLKTSLDTQQKLYENELNLQQKNYERHRQLNREKMVSDTQLEQMEGELIRSRRQLEALRSGIIDQSLRIEQLRSQMQVLQADRSDEIADQFMEVQQWTDRLQATIRQWQHNYLLKAPIAGKVNFDRIRSSQQFIQVGAVVFTLIPDEQQGQIIAQCLVPLRGAGKIAFGSRANIRLDAYPHREFGILPSTIDKIALIPLKGEGGENNYQMEMHLPDELITTYNKTIPFRQGMTGRVHVITEDRRIVERIFDHLISIVKNG